MKYPNVFAKIILFEKYKNKFGGISLRLQVMQSSDEEWHFGVLNKITVV